MDKMRFVFVRIIVERHHAVLFQTLFNVCDPWEVLLHRNIIGSPDVGVYSS